MRAIKMVVSLVVLVAAVGCAAGAPPRELSPEAKGAVPALWETRISNSASQGTRLRDEYQPVGGRFRTTPPTLTNDEQSEAALNNKGAMHVSIQENAAGATTQKVDVEKWGGAATTLGQKAMTASVPVVVSSDQSTLNVETELPAATLAAPLRVDPTGTTTQPVETELPAAGAATPLHVRPSDGAAAQTFSELDVDSGAGTVNRISVGLAGAAAGGPVAIEGTAANGIEVDVTRVQGTVTVETELPAGAAATPVHVRGSDGAAAYDVAKASQLPSALGQAAMAGSVSVAIASNQSTVNVETELPAGTAAAPVGVRPSDGAAFATPFDVDADSGAGTVTRQGTALVGAASGGPIVVAAATGAPAGTEVGLIVRNVPSGTQTVETELPAGAAGTPVHVRPSDGAAAQTFSELDVDSGAGTVSRIATGIAGAASGGPVAVAASTGAPAGTEAGLIVRNIPSGTQTVETELPAAGATTPIHVRGTDNTTAFDLAKGTQLPTALVGGRLDANAGAWLGSTAPTVGQKTMANSVPVALASDASTVAVKKLAPSQKTYAFTFNVAGPIGTAVEIIGPTAGSCEILEVYITKPSAATTVTINKRSAAATLGTTGTAPTIVPHDATFAAATTVVKVYTADPTEGTLVGEIFRDAMGTGDRVAFATGDTIGAPITLNANTQVITIELSAAATLVGRVVFTER